MKEDIDGLIAALSALIAQQQAVANLAASLQQHVMPPDAGSCARTQTRVRLRSTLLQSCLAEIEQAVNVQGRELHWHLDFFSNEFIPEFTTNK